MIGNNVFIYALCDPRTEEIRYVGSSCNPLSRFGDHIRYEDDIPKSCWIAKLRETGDMPLIVGLESIPHKMFTVKRERAWIVKAKQAGYDLLNQGMDTSKPDLDFSGIDFERHIDLPEMSRVAIKVTPEEHKRLKIQAIIAGRTLQDICHDLIVDWLNQDLESDDTNA